MSTVSTIRETHTDESGGDLVREALSDALARLDPVGRRLCSYHLGFTDKDQQPVQDRAAGGKGVRSRLSLLSTRAAGAAVADGIPAAVAVELVHNFSLLHDDLMDADTERRHRPTVWSAFGRSEAILAGDALLALASEVLAESGATGATWAIRCLNAATRRLVAGQFADLSFESRTDVTLDEAVLMARDKTGALLSCAASLGTVLAGGGAPLALGLADYGDHVGLAFQLADDLLGIWGDPAVTGKPVRSDLRSGKKSLPVVAALTSGTPAGHELLVRYVHGESRSEDQLLEMAELIDRAGGRRWAQGAADRELTAALAALADLPVPTDVTDTLTHLAVSLAGRDR